MLAEEHEALKSGRLLRQGAEPNTVEICRCIAAEEKAVHSACILYRVLQVSRSGYYAWSERDPSQGQIADEALLRQSRSIGRAARPTVQDLRLRLPRPSVHTRHRQGPPGMPSSPPSCWRMGSPPLHPGPARHGGRRTGAGMPSVRASARSRGPLASPAGA